jgi:hypothetical protein
MRTGVINYAFRYLAFFGLAWRAGVIESFSVSCPLNSRNMAHVYSSRGM